MRDVTKGKLMATAVAGLFLSACAKTGTTETSASAATDANKKVPCYGVNECKAKGECGSKKTGTSCAGSNSCKGKGWISLTEEDCKAKGGSLTES